MFSHSLFLLWWCSAVNPDCYTVWYFSEECAEVRQELAGVMDTSDSD